MTKSRRAMLLAAAWIAGCGGTSTGDVIFLLGAEGSITDGLVPGPNEEDTVDGWSVTFSKFIVAVGEVGLARSDAPDEASVDTVRVVDATSLPPAGLVLADLEGVTAGRWDLVEFATPIATAAAVRDPSVSTADFDAMVAAGWTYLLEGVIENPTGQSCAPGGACVTATSVTFRIGAGVDVRFHACQAEGAPLPGLSVPAGGTATGEATLHGDHIFFDAFPTGEEGTIARRVQWLANADLDGDGHVENAELDSVAASAIFPASLYTLTGAPFPIDDAYDFVRAQLATQGHFQGEGECVWELR